MHPQRMTEIQEDLLDFDTAIAPCTRQTFFDEYFGRRFMYQRGISARFARLLPWSALNHILAHHTPDPSRVKLVKDGMRVQPEQYTSFRNARLGRLDAVSVTEHLRDGATLIMDFIQDQYPPLRAFCDRLERVLRLPIQVNAYAVWRTTRGFDLHWDDHDVIILQLYGRKRWEIHGEVERLPVVRFDPSKRPRNSQAIWQETLEDGDLLYIPRGWAHVALPCDEPTMHLTFGLHGFTTVMFLQWLVETLKTQELMRASVPRLATTTVQADYISAIGQMMSGSLAAPDVLLRYLEQVDLFGPHSPAFGLPWSATPALIPPRPLIDSCLIRLLSAGGVLLKDSSDGTSLEVFANGRLYRYPLQARPLLELLNERAPLSVADFIGDAPQEQHQRLLDFLTDLVRGGLAAICEAD